MISEHTILLWHNGQDAIAALTVSDLVHFLGP
jgi:hypothetical protein